MHFYIELSVMNVSRQMKAWKNLEDRHYIITLSLLLRRIFNQPKLTKATLKNLRKRTLHQQQSPKL